MIEIIPAIMPKSYEDLENKLAHVASHTDFVQLDIMDGKFVKSRTWPYYTSDRESFENLLTESDGLPYWDKTNFEIDLMVQHPETVLDDWITAGVARLIFHVESISDMKPVFDALHTRFGYLEGKNPDIEIGLALNIATPTDTILPYLEDIHFVQFMGIDTIGLQGQSFNDQVVDKIRDFHNAHPEFIISVDGGVDFDNAKLLAEAGAQRLVSGSVIFHGSVSDNILQFKSFFS
jgi:ribulose-phosphate 3-epimerase